VINSDFSPTILYQFTSLETALIKQCWMAGVNQTCSATVIRLLESTSRPSSFSLTRRHTPTAYEFRSCTAAKCTVADHPSHANEHDKAMLQFVTEYTVQK